MTEFGDIPVVRSPYCPEGTAYLINTNTTHFIVLHKPTRWQRFKRWLRRGFGPRTWEDVAGW